ncbi:MAG: hypothetical protein ACLQO1_05440, partial [Steroidobacteraceae bacterium]
GPVDTSRAWRIEALIAWALGSAWAALSSGWGWQITPVPALDSVCAAAYAALRKLAARCNAPRNDGAPAQGDLSSQAPPCASHGCDRVVAARVRRLIWRSPSGGLTVAAR